MKIEIVCRESIKPTSPTPLQLQDYKLSFIDERIPNTYIPLILFYSFNEADKNNTAQSEMSHRLKNSLSDTLVRFYPLAGRMRGQASVHCNDEGILYVEACVDALIFALIECPKNDVLDKLLPFKSNGAISSCEEQLAVQVSFFKDGGFSVGACISHRISDGFTLGSFIKSWAAISCGGQSHLMTPVYNAATLFPPRNATDFKPNFRNLSVQPATDAKYVAKRFVFTASEIDVLKERVIKNSSIVNPTRVEVLSGFLWYHCTVVKGVEKPRKSVAFHPVNLRGRIQFLSDCSFGNLFQMTKAVATVDDQTDWIELVQKMRDAFKKINREYMMELLGQKGCHLARENFIEIGKLLGSEDIEVFRFSSYCRFPFQDADFGWGKPVWVSTGGSCIRNVINLLDSVKTDGGIEAWVVMADTDMHRLHQKLKFLGYHSSSSG